MQARRKHEKIGGGGGALFLGPLFDKKKAK